GGLGVKVTERVSGQLVPFLGALAEGGKMSLDQVEGKIFQGPGKIIKTMMGGDLINLDRAMDLLSIGYVHPLVQTILCVWAVGRAAGAIAGELDRGTMELLLAQPLARSRLIMAHLCVDLITIPILCLSLWAGNYLGRQMIGPIELRPLPGPTSSPAATQYLIELGPLKVRVAGPAGGIPRTAEENQQRLRDRLRVEPAEFGRGLGAVAGLVFAVSGLTLWLS